MASGPRSASSSSATASRACPGTSPIARSFRRPRCPRICSRTMWCCGPAPRRTWCTIRCARAMSITSSSCSTAAVTKRAGIPTATLRSCASASRTNARRCWNFWRWSMPGKCGCCATANRSRGGAGGASSCSEMPLTPCCSIWLRAPAWPPKTRLYLPSKLDAAPDDLPGAFRAYVQERYLRTARRPDHGPRLR